MSSFAEMSCPKCPVSLELIIHDRGADLCSALGGIILEIYQFLSKFQLWGGGDGLNMLKISWYENFLELKGF